jgi:hypothetical protein
MYICRRIPKEDMRHQYISGDAGRDESRRDALFAKHVTVVRTANCRALTRDASTEADKQASLFFLLSSSPLSTTDIRLSNFYLSLPLSSLVLTISISLPHHISQR